MVALLCTITLISIVRVCILLRMNGIPTDLRNTVNKRHILYGLIYIIMMLEIFKNFYYVKENGDIEGGVLSHRMEYIWELFVCLCGFILGSIKLSEPLVYYTVRSWISKKIFC